MRSFTRRGLASLAVASVLIFAPLASTAAFADDEPVVETPVVETPPVETPSEEPPAEPAPSDVPPAEETPVADDPSADSDAASDTPAPSASRSLAPAYDCDYSSSPLSYNSPFYPFCVDESSDGTSATMFWTPVSGGYSNYVEVSDITADWTVVAGGEGTESPFGYSTIPGHQYFVYIQQYTGSTYYMGQLYYTAATRAPAAPTALKATRDVDANAFDLSWAAPAENVDNPVVSYTVDVTPTSTGVTSSSSTTTTTFAATGLTIGEQYTFTVTAVGQNGELSAPVWITENLYAKAPTAVTNLTLSRMGAALSASWTPPAYDGGAGPVKYSIYLYADGVFINSYDRSGTSIQLDRTAEHGVEYLVQVVPYTDDTWSGPSTDSNTVERPDSAPAAPVAFTHADRYKDAWIYVTWDLAPVTGSDADSVIVTLYSTAGAVVDRQNISLEGNRTGMYLKGLPNDTDFTVTVAAVNKAGTSPESSAVPVTTLPLTPPAYAPEDLALHTAFSEVTVSLSGTELTAHIGGAAEGDWVFGHAYSTPTALGWVQVDAAGMARWNIAAADLPAGAHTLAVQNTFGELLGSAGFTVGAPARAALASTGSDPSGSVTLALAMLALGVLATATRLRRRARS